MPVNTAAPGFFGGDFANLLHQFRIAGASETNVVWENHRALSLAVSVHRVDTKN